MEADVIISWWNSSVEHIMSLQMWRTVLEDRPLMVAHGVRALEWRDERESDETKDGKCGLGDERGDGVFEKGLYSLVSMSVYQNSRGE